MVKIIDLFKLIPQKKISFHLHVTAMNGKSSKKDSNKRLTKLMFNFQKTECVAYEYIKNCINGC